MFRVERSQTSNENRFCQDKLHWTTLKIYKVEYISKLPSFNRICVRLIFGLLLLPTCAVFKRGAEMVCMFSQRVILFIWEDLFSFCLRCWHLSENTEKTQKAPVSDCTSRHCNKLFCLLHPQLGAIALTLTSNSGLYYFVHIQQEQQYSTYLADEMDCQGHCVYRIPFRYFSNIPRSSPQSPQDPLLDIFSR